MTIKKIALGACLLVSSTALTQDTTYTVRQGDTLSEIASKFGANSKAILSANHLPSADKLKLGQKLIIPIASKQTSASTAISGNVYTVGAGDTDESIAKRVGVTAKELRVANMGTQWTRLQIGQKLVIPTTKGWFQSMANHAANQAHSAPSMDAKPAFTLATSIKATPAAPKVVQRTYTVRKGDNDWIIAKRVGIKPSVLKTLNPSVKWTNLQIGTVLKVPGTKVLAPKGSAIAENEPNLPKLRSRYAVITGDAVTIRRGPSVRFPSLAQVDKGTRVLVLDRDGSWYKLRFPKGTEAWVRADFLAPTKAPQVLAMKANTSKSTTKKKSSTVVASKSNRPSSRSSRNSRNVTARRPAKDNGRPLVVASGDGSSLLEKASSFLGVRYRYGAASRSATDCSGFTTQVFRSQGVKLPRTAREQSSRGQKVAKGSLKPGDLVFFNTRGSRVSHVGIYKGNGKFIHASSGRGKVMVSDLNEGYYKRRFAGARRVISNKGTTEKKVVKKEEPKEAPVEPVTNPAEQKSSAPPDNGDKG